MLAAFLYAPYHVPSTVVVNDDGSIDEAGTFTPGQFAAIERMLTPAQRAFYLSPPKHSAHIVGRRS